MSTATEELLLATSDVDIQAAGKTPAVTIVAYTGGEMVVPGWGPLVLDLAGVDVSASQISILADHDSTLRGVVGFGQASVANGKLLVAGTIAPTNEAAKQIIELARSGFQFQASVGVAPGESKRVRAGDIVEVNGRTIRATGSGFTLVRSSALKEVSIVAIGADAGTSVAIAASQEGEEALMTTTEKTAEDIRAEAAAETERITAIRRACNGEHGDIEAQAIREGWSGQQTELAVLRASRPRGPYIQTTTVAPTRDVIEAAVLVHMGHENLVEKHLGPQTAQQARELRATSLVDLCRAALMVEQRDAPSGREALIRAALSTYSLPVALGNAANKVLLDAYTESPATWRAFAAIKSAADFKDHTGIRPSDTGDLTQVAPGGELKHGSIDEATYQYSVDTFGKMLSIDRRDIINDDLGLFEDTAMSLGRAAMRAVSDLAYTTLLGGAGSFFSAGNGNFDTGAGSTLDAIALATGIARMMAQRDDEDRDLDIRPRTLLVPPELQQTAKELLQSDFIQRANNDEPTGNALKNVVSLEVEPRLSNSARFTGTSDKAWYLFAGRQDAAIVVAFLQGKQSPTVEFFGFDADPNKLAATWRVYHDFGSALGDYRAAYKADGE
ncbi:Mu-like prophage major head subunit gpT [Bremerella volcania]|uniref:Mu-like prophage major head subunit gpT n=1 Tax=Bremerella volcania TaxID=2527984 RepID=A0A518CCE8_9BACT|nr:Mu-like prophage major head subunit gpT family protein [Bremerella volcania]QDU76897.1 Mu-like prophage major head subunit gpT [Bremerella volcania]